MSPSNPAEDPAVDPVTTTDESTSQVVPVPTDSAEPPAETKKDVVLPAIVQPFFVALCFIMKCYEKIGLYIAGKPKEEKNPQANTIHGSTEITDASKGSFFTFLSILMFVPSLILNRLAVGVILPDPEPFKLAMLGYVLTVDPTTLFAVAVSFGIAACGIFAIDSHHMMKILGDELPSSTAAPAIPPKRNSRTHKIVRLPKPKPQPVPPMLIIFWTMLISMIVILAFLAANRTYVFNGNRFGLNVIAVLFLTIIVEASQAFSTSFGFRLLIGPLINRAFLWLEDGWYWVQGFFRLLVGIVMGIGLIPALMGCFAVFVIACIAYILVIIVSHVAKWIVETLRRIFRWLWKKMVEMYDLFREWLADGETRRETRHKHRLDDQTKRKQAQLEQIDHDLEVREKKIDAKRKLNEFKRKNKKSFWSRFSGKEA